MPPPPLCAGPIRRAARRAAPGRAGSPAIRPPFPPRVGAPRPSCRRPLLIGWLLPRAAPPARPPCCPAGCQRPRAPFARGPLARQNHPTVSAALAPHPFLFARADWPLVAPFKYPYPILSSYTPPLPLFWNPLVWSEWTASASKPLPPPLPPPTTTTPLPHLPALLLLRAAGARGAASCQWGAATTNPASRLSLHACRMLLVLPKNPFYCSLSLSSLPPQPARHSPPNLQPPDRLGLRPGGRRAAQSPQETPAAGAPRSADLPPCHSAPPAGARRAPSPLRRPRCRAGTPLHLPPISSCLAGHPPPF